MKNRLLNYLLIWVIVGFFLSPQIYTDKIAREASAKQMAFMRIKQVTQADLDGDSILFVCFRAEFAGEENIYSLTLDVNSLLEDKKLPGISPNRIAQDIGRNEYNVSYQNIKLGCTNRKHDKSFAIGMLTARERGNIVWLKPPEGKEAAIYGVASEWYDSELHIVGKPTGKDGYMTFDITPKTMPKKKYYLLLWPLAAIADGLLFPIEWYMFLSHKG